MPRYDYKCPECDHRFEARHGFTETPPACPECGHESVERVITSAPTVAQGFMAHPGDGRKASQEQLQDKWREETPRLRKQLEKKLGPEVVRKNAPNLYSNSD